MPGEVEFTHQSSGRAIWTLSVSVEGQRLMMGPGGLFEGATTAELKGQVWARAPVLAKGLGIAGPFEFGWASLKNDRTYYGEAVVRRRKCQIWLLMKRKRNHPRQKMTCWDQWAVANGLTSQ